MVRSKRCESAADLIQVFAVFLTASNGVPKTGWGSFGVAEDVWVRCLPLCPGAAGARATKQTTFGSL